MLMEEVWKDVFEYVGLYQVSEHKKGKNTKQVLQFTTDGTLVKEWDSITEAAKANGLYAQNISGVLHCHQATCGGYIWKYKKEGD